MKTNKSIKKPSTLKRFIIPSIIVIVIGIGVTAFALYKNAPSTTNTETRGINSVDYSGPTQQESEAGTLQKEANKEREALDQSPPATTANLVITDATQYSDGIEVRAYSPNVYEDNGTCTATFTLAGATPVVVSHAAFKDATTTQCGALDVARSVFSQPGNWSVVVNYKSSQSQGSSAAQTVIIK